MNTEPYTAEQVINNLGIFVEMLERMPDTHSVRWMRCQAISIRARGIALPLPLNDGACKHCGSTILLGRMKHHLTWCGPSNAKAPDGALSEIGGRQ